MNVYSQSLNAVKGIRSLALSLGTSSKSSPPPTVAFDLNDLPSKPKRPPTAWNRFVNEHKDSLKGLKAAEFSKTFAAKWSSMDPSAKAPYEEAYKRDLVKYEQVKREYDSVMNQMIAVKDVAKLVGEMKHKNEKPKSTRLPNGYNLFVAEVMAKDRPVLSSGKPDLTSIARSWRALPDSQRHAYTQRAREQSISSKDKP